MDKVNEFFVDYDKKRNELFNTINPILIDFGRKDLALFPADHQNYIIRNSIFYRLDCIKYHLIVLISTINQASFELKENLGSNRTDNYMMMYSSRDQALYLFDDVIFHIASLMDYLGNLIGYLYLNELNKKWNNMIKSASDRNNIFANYEIASLMVASHKEWVDNLINYRSGLIHNKKDNADGGSKTTFLNNDVQVTFKVKAPLEFCKKIKVLKQEILQDTREPELIEVALWITGKSLDTANKMAICLKHELQSKLKEFNDIREEKYKKLVQTKF